MFALFNRDLNQAAGSVGVFGFHCQINYFVIQVEVSWSLMLWAKAISVNPSKAYSNSLIDLKRPVTGT